MKHGGALWPASLSAVIINSVSQALSPSTPQMFAETHSVHRCPQRGREGHGTQDTWVDICNRPLSNYIFTSPRSPGKNVIGIIAEQTFMSEGSIVIRRKTG